MIGELAVNELMHMNVLGQQDIRFQSTMDKYQVVSVNGIIDYMTYEMTQIPLSAYNGHS